MHSVITNTRIYIEALDRVSHCLFGGIR